MIKSGQIDPTDVKIVLHATDKTYGGERHSWFELPTTSEIELLMLNFLQSNQERLLVCSLKDQIGEEQLQFIPDCHGLYGPLQYPCFFSYMVLMDMAL